ncbi:MAG: ATP-binding protein, partial [Acidimicrobiales bacterium]
MAAKHQTGMLAFLFTDIEDSTRRWALDRSAMSRALVAHDESITSAVSGSGGRVFKHTGDGICAVFDRVGSALEAALDAQQVMELPVRMGIHVGEAEERDNDFFGPTLNVAARVADAAHGGQIVVSATAQAMLDSDRHDLIDLGAHQLRGVSRAVGVWQVGAERFPPLRASGGIGNLPLEPPSLVGRDAELEELVSDIGQHRLVTLTGVGGVGKTRLALRAAAEVASSFEDGVWVVEFAPVTEAGAVSHAMAATLGVTQQAGKSLVDSIADALRGQRSLLVVDNCEHVLGPVSELIEAIVQTTDQVQVLATSREGLGIAGERVWPVRSLEVGSGVRSAAVELFVDRAQAVDRDQDVGADLTVVVEICRRLDGIPLAIELAAARTRALSPAEISERLDDMFQL